MTGVEALVRWNHPTRGLLSPAEFIDIAERIGLINALGQWVLNTACRQAVAWREAGLPDLQVAVNIATSHFLESDFAVFVVVMKVEKDIHKNAAADTGSRHDRVDFSSRS